MFTKIKTMAFLFCILFFNIQAQHINFCYITEGGRYTNKTQSTEQLVAVSTCYNFQNSPNAIYSYVKLFTDNGEYDSRNGIPGYLMRTPGSYSWRLELIEYLVNWEEKKTIHAYNFIAAFAVAGANSFNGGNINIDGHVFPSNTYVSKLPYEFINLSAMDQEYDFIPRVWNASSEWKRYNGNISVAGSNRELSYLVHNDDNGTILRAEMKSIPNWPSATPRNLGFSSSTDGNILLTWNEHPNSSVSQYRIWRKTNTEGPQLIATVSRGTTSFEDDRFRKNGSMAVYYDVRAYYSIESTISDESWASTSGFDTGVSKENNIGDAEPLTYQLINYPNPFNPTTTIEYQLPKAGQVTIRVYSALGKEVANLVNDFKSEGRHTVDFNGSSLASGIYYCEFRVNDFTTIKKMLMIK